MKNYFRLLVGAAIPSMALVSAAAAQEVIQTTPAQVEADAAEDEGDIVVTGSRLRKNSFTSPSPLQSIDVEQQRKIGVSSIQDLISRTTVANGNQIDQTLNTNAGNSNATEAPPDGGVGSSNVNLRNLGPARTLILINGRRLAATGVRGAPSQPDLNLIPLNLVKNVDILTEGASSIYGADAVAGVVNLTLRDDFEGVEVSTNFQQPQNSGGNIYQASLLAGAKSERARVVFSAEWYERERVLTGERDFSSSLREISIGPDGQRRSVNRSGFFDNVIVAPGSLPPGFVDPLNGGAAVAANTFFFYTPGRSDIGIPNFSSGFGLPVPGAPLFDPAINNPAIPGDEVPGNSSTRFPLLDFYNDQDDRRASDLVGELGRFSIVTLGSFDFNSFGNTQFYYEAYYLNRRSVAFGATEQIFPDIRGQIPLVNLRDPGGPINGGFDPVISGGAPVTVDNPLNPFPIDVAPILTLDSVPQTRNVELEQFRFVSGFRGDIEAGWFGEKGWNWDTYFSYDRGIGFQSQPILFEPNLELATLTVRQIANGPNAGQVVCGIPNDTDQNGAFLTSNACVPVNFFAPNIFTGGNGEGAFTQAESDYLIGQRTNRTAIEQYVWNGFVSGDVVKSPWGGVVTAGLGAEWRRDVITSQNSTDGVFGTNAAESPSTEGNTIGSRRFYEFFGEVNIPLIEDKPLVYSLNIDGAVRYTNESNFGGGVTYRGRLQYRPTDYISLSGAYGTSYRAPNLREQFLADQGGGVGGNLDPCISQNIIALAGSSILPTVIANCIAAGVQFTDSDGDGLPDATVLGTQGITTIPTVSGGNADLDRETSRSFTISSSFSQPWSDAFDFNLAVSYYNIRINGTVSEPPASFIINNCYLDPAFPNLTSAFCSLITRPGGAAASNIINSVNVSFFNIGEQTAKGIDVNTRLAFDLPFSIGDTPISFTHSTTTSYQLEAEVETFSAADRDDNVGEIGTPAFRFNNVASLTWGRWSLITENRRIGASDNDPTVAAAVRFLDQLPALTAAQRVAIGNIVVDFVDPVWYHDASLSYTKDNYGLTFGVRNIGNRAPPLIDGGLSNQRNNAVTSSGYDLFGRTFFINASVRF